MRLGKPPDPPARSTCYFCTARVARRHPLSDGCTVRTGDVFSAASQFIAPPLRKRGVRISRRTHRRTSAFCSSRSTSLRRYRASRPSFRTGKVRSFSLRLTVSFETCQRSQSCLRVSRPSSFELFFCIRVVAYAVAHYAIPAQESRGDNFERPLTMFGHRRFTARSATDFLKPFLVSLYLIS